MAYKIQFDERLVSELADIVLAYERQSSAVAEKFQAAFTLVIEILSGGRIDYTTFHEEIRRAPVPNFPYMIYYSRQEDRQSVFVHAVLHSWRSGDFIQERLSSE